MARWKLTSKILENIEMYAEDQYTLEELFNELNISSKLMKDEQVIQAFKKGLHRRKEAEELATKQFSNPLMSGMVNILEQNGHGSPSVSQEVLSEDIKKMVEKIQSGDTKALITMLTTNIMQLQLFNGTVTRNLMGDAGKKMDNFNKLSNMQLKVMQETRKSIMAINEITNPKRTTFIKEANQHNHLHQNSEKNDENENEKRIEHKDVTEAEVYEVKETAYENK